MAGTLPEPFAGWFAARGWQPRAHQRDVLEAAQAGCSVLLIAPTGGGKTLAGFLPSLIELAAQGTARAAGLHTLYVSPLKALGTDVARNLMAPVAEMGLDIRTETRSGDTPANRRTRQRENPPDILLTTPESLAVMLSAADAPARFASLSALVIDEVHALAGTKRGDQLALCAARLARLAPRMRRIGLSATIAHPAAIAAYVGAARIITAPPGAAAEMAMLLPAGRLSWSGHMGLDAAPEILAAIAAARLSIVFVNTRAQAELLFQALWRINADTLPIALHHGSLDIAQRRKVEAAMAEGRLAAVIATSSLDLGLDWGGVDQVLQVGAPKGVARLAQRIGRANHRMDEASRAILVPANRFEVLECEAAMEGMAAGELDGEAPRAGGLDVLAQHIMGMACAAPFRPDDLYEEIRSAAPYASLSRRDFDDVLGFVAHGGYALAAYAQFRRLFEDAEGLIHAAGDRVALRHRMNIGTIVEEPLIAVRLAGRGRRGAMTGGAISGGAISGGAMLGEVEEYFAAQLRPGDTFLFAGRLLRFRALSATALIAEEGGTGDPAIPAYAGGRLPLSTYLAARVRAILHDPRRWPALPEPVRDWLAMQRLRSRMPGPERLLIETFPRGGRWYLIAYCFEGRNAHQTLGMLLTRRMARARLAPMGFVATDYVLGIWSAVEPTGIEALFEEDMLGEDLDSWMAESSMLRRGFRTVAVIAGLIERHRPGADKNRRQVTISSDLIYDVLRRHQPDHVLLRATRADAAAGMIDLDRIAAMLARARGSIAHVALDRVSPLAVPVLLEIGREQVGGRQSEDHLLAEAEALAAEAAPTAKPAPTPARKPRPARMRTP